MTYVTVGDDGRSHDDSDACCEGGAASDALWCGMAYLQAAVKEPSNASANLVVSCLSIQPLQSHVRLAFVDRRLNFPSSKAYNSPLAPTCS